MQLPLQITFRNMHPSTAVENAVREKVQKLERFYDRITGCRVVIEAPHRQHIKGNLFCVRVDLAVPEDELVVSREAAHGHEDVYVAVRDAFEAMMRQLKEYARRRRGEVKRREPPLPVEPPLTVGPTLASDAELRPMH